MACYAVMWYIIKGIKLYSVDGIGFVIPKLKHWLAKFLMRPMVFFQLKLFNEGS